MRALFNETKQLLADNRKYGLYITVKVKSEEKTNPQLGYLFGVAYPEIQAYMREDGNEHSLEYIDLFFKDKFLCYYDEQGVKHIISKAKVSSLEMFEYIYKIIRWAADMGWAITPPPDKWA